MPVIPISARVVANPRRLPRSRMEHFSFRDPEIERMAAIAADLDAVGMPYAQYSE